MMNVEVSSVNDEVKPTNADYAMQPQVVVGAPQDAQFDITDSAVKYGYEGLLSLSSSIMMCSRDTQTAPAIAQPKVPQKEVTDKLTVTLFQKKRGNGGVWQPIEENERIRVDKSKGKLLRLVVTPTSTSYSINEKGWEFAFHMNSLRNGTITALPGDGFTVDLWQLKQSGNESKEFKIKLTRISKSQNFFVNAYKGGVLLVGSSITFRSDDNGKVYTSNKRPRLNTSVSPVALAKKTLQPLKAINPSLYNLCSDSEFVNMIAQSLVPVLLDKISQTTSPTGNNTNTVTPPPATASESPVIQSISSDDSTACIHVNIPIPSSLPQLNSGGNEPLEENANTEATSVAVSSLQSQSCTLPTLSPLTQ